MVPTVEYALSILYSFAEGKIPDIYTLPLSRLQKATTSLIFSHNREDLVQQRIERMSVSSLLTHLFMGILRMDTKKPPRRTVFINPYFGGLVNADGVEVGKCFFNALN